MTPYYENTHTCIYHGEASSILAELPTGMVDILMTDPPYSSGGMFRSDRVKEPSEKYRGWSQEADGRSPIDTSGFDHDSLVTGDGTLTDIGRALREAVS